MKSDIDKAVSIANVMTQKVNEGVTIPEAFDYVMGPGRFLQLAVAVYDDIINVHEMIKADQERMGNHDSRH